MDDFGLEIRDTVPDVVLACTALGIIGLNWLTLIFYLIYQRTRQRTGAVKSKADRPLYITGLVFSSTAWILGTLYTTGTIAVREPVPYLPAVMIYAVQYLLGVLLWLWLTIDRMLRRYSQVRFAGSAQRARALLLRHLSMAVAFVPFLVLSAVAVALDKVEVNALGVTDQDDVFEAILVAYLGLYLLAISFLAVKTRRIIGDFHELIRYTVFILTTMLFFVYDAMTTLWHGLQTELVAQHVLLGLVLLIVAGDLYWVLILALRPKRRPKDVEDAADAVRRPPSDSDALNDIIDSGSVGARVGAPTAPPPAYDAAKGLLILRRPRLQLAGDVAAPYRLLVDALPAALAQQLDSTAGGLAPPTDTRRLAFRPLLGYTAEIPFAP